jgi:hypothetical protein
MEAKQMEIFAGFFGGMQVAYVELVREIEESGHLKSKALAQRLEAKAAEIPGVIRNREQVVMMLTQLAKLLIDDSAQGSGKPDDDLLN